MTLRKNNVSTGPQSGAWKWKIDQLLWSNSGITSPATNFPEVQANMAARKRKRRAMSHFFIIPSRLPSYELGLVELGTPLYHSSSSFFFNQYDDNTVAEHAAAQSKIVSTTDCCPYYLWNIWKTPPTTVPDPRLMLPKYRPLVHWVFYSIYLTSTGLPAETFP